MSKRKPKTRPPIAGDLFERFIDEAYRLAKMIDLSARGISIVQSMPKVVEALAKVKSVDDGSHAERLARAQAEALLAEEEVTEGFPLLYGWAVIGLWSLLEELMKSFVAEWLQKSPDAWKAEEVQRLKVRLGEYETLPRSERYMFVAELFEKEVAAGLKNGAARFDALLKPFGLGGPIPDVVQRLIYEMGQARNLIVHRGGRVDKAFKAACPWVKCKIGQELAISGQMWTAYYDAVHIYVVLLICRLGEWRGTDMTENVADMMAQADRLASNQSLQATARKPRRA